MSTDNKEKIIFGGFISILIILGLFILSTIILTCVYFCGFGMGWLMNLVIGVDGIVFGLTFPQLFGVLVTLTTMMAGSVGTIILFNNRNIQKNICKIKKIEKTENETH